MGWWLAAWIGCQSLDLGTTQYGLSHGSFREGNAAMSHRALMPVKVSVNVAMFWTYHKTKVKNVPLAMAAAGCTGGAWNLYQLNRR